MLAMDPALIFAPIAPYIENQAITDVRDRNLVRLKTANDVDDVRWIVDYPLLFEEQLEYRYCCPICLRFFNCMLESSCCRNYICRLCSNQMMQRAMRNSEYAVRCAHCME